MPLMAELIAQLTVFQQHPAHLVGVHQQPETSVHRRPSHAGQGSVQLLRREGPALSCYRADHQAPWLGIPVSQVAQLRHDVVHHRGGTRSRVLVSVMSLCLRYHNDTVYREIITGIVACQLRRNRHAGQVCDSGEDRDPTNSSPFKMGHAFTRLPRFARNDSPVIPDPQCKDAAGTRSISEIVWREQQTGDGYRWRQSSDQFCYGLPPEVRGVQRCSGEC